MEGVGFGVLRGWVSVVGCRDVARGRSLSCILLCEVHSRPVSFLVSTAVVQDAEPKMSHSLNSLKGLYGDYIGDHCNYGLLRRILRGV